MGATTFFNIGKGATAQEVFDRLHQQALYQHGHGGYTGTIAEKSTYTLFQRPKGMRRKTVIEAVQSLEQICPTGISEACDHMHDDNPKPSTIQAKFPKLPIYLMWEVFDRKFGPALAIQLRPGEYLFAGFASE